MTRILVVDDHLAVRTTLRMVLEEQGHIVDEEGDGDRAVAALRACPVPVVALIDLFLGTEGKNPVVAALAADPTLAARHCFIWMTAGSLEEAERITIPVRRFGVRLATKPFDLSVLFGMVDDAARNLPSAKPERPTLTPFGTVHPAEPGTASPAR